MFWICDIDNIQLLRRCCLNNIMHKSSNLINGENDINKAELENNNDIF